MGNKINNSLERAKSALNLKDLKKFNQKKAVKLIKKVQDETINQEHLEALIKALPHIAQVTTESLHLMTTVSEKAGNEGNIALEALKTCVESLKMLSQRENLSDEIIKEITHTTIEAAKILKEINRDNKTFWASVYAIIAIVICLPLIIYKKGSS